MTYPKVNNSKDGVDRMTVSVSYRISLNDLEVAFGDLLCYDFNLNLYETTLMEHEAEILANVSKADIMKRMRHLLWEKGVNFHYAPESWDHEEQYTDFAKKHIGKYFPEYKEANQ